MAVVLWLTASCYWLLGVTPRLTTSEWLLKATTELYNIHEHKKPTQKPLYQYTQAAPDVRIGRGQRRRAPKIRSKLGVSGGMPPGKFFFFDNAKCCKLGHFYHFCQAFGPPLGAAYARSNGTANPKASTMWVCCSFRGRGWGYFVM